MANTITVRLKRFKKTYMGSTHKRIWGICNKTVGEIFDVRSKRVLLTASSIPFAGAKRVITIPFTRIVYLEGFHEVCENLKIVWRKQFFYRLWIWVDVEKYNV